LVIQSSLIANYLSAETFRGLFIFFPPKR